MTAKLTIGAALILLCVGAALAQSAPAAPAQQAQQATAGQMDNFKKAFSVCLESSKYMVKF